VQDLPHGRHYSHTQKDGDGEHREESMPSGSLKIEIIVFIDQPNGGQGSIHRLGSGVLVKSKGIELGGHG